MSEYELHEAAPSERRDRDRYSADAWRRKLSVEHYLERLQALRDEPFTKDRIRTWILSREDLVVASCDTVRMESELTENGRQGVTEVISRVYVEPGLRGKGHAAEMLAGLIARARRDEVQATLLFSEIGERLYAQFGFRTLKGFNWIFTRDESEKLGGGKPTSRFFTVEELSEVMPPEGLLTNGRFSLIAERSQVSWHLCRARNYALAHKKKAITRIGARYDDKAFILWEHDFINSQLLVLWLEATDRHQAEDLLLAALDEAFSYDLKRVVLMQVPGVNPLVEFCRRAPHQILPMILPISPDLRASDWTDVTFLHWF